MKGRTQALEDLAAELLARGLSVRDIEDAFRDETGRLLLSRTAVSELGERLWADYQEFAGRDPCEYDIAYLFVDGIAARVRPGQKREPVQAAWGFTSAGAKILPHLMAGSKEDAETVSAFFQDMRARGLGAQAADGTGFRRLCHPALLRLAADTGDTVFLMARSGFNTVCVDRQEGSYMIDSLTGQVGGQIPLGVGPASQAILAYLPPEEADVILQTNAPLYGKFNKLSAEEIKGRLPEIRKQGYAFDHGRLVEGISAIAVPILPQGRDVVGSIAINMTSARLNPARLQEIISLLRREIREIEQSINPMDFVEKRQLQR